MKTLGCVPYVNAKPLVQRFANDPSEDLRIRFAVPSKLPTWLDTGEADAVLASSFEAIRTPGRRVVDGVAIATQGPAESVRLFSRVPFARIERLALDASSLTSNHLARILLAERFGARPHVMPALPNLRAMLETADAAILIGDIGMTTDGAGLHVLDLGACWRETTGLPFVWALWIGGPGLDSALADTLREAKAWGTAHLNEFLAEVASQAGWPVETARRYLGHTMDFDLTTTHREGLARYAEYLQRHEFVAQAHLPEFI